MVTNSDSNEKHTNTCGEESSTKNGAGVPFHLYAVAVFLILYVLGIISYLGSVSHSGITLDRVLNAGSAITTAVLEEGESQDFKAAKMPKIGSVEDILALSHNTLAKRKEDDFSVKQGLADYFKGPIVLVSISLNDNTSKKLEYTATAVSNTFDFKTKYFVSNPIPREDCEIVNKHLKSQHDKSGWSMRTYLKEPSEACVVLDGTYRVAFKYLL